MIANGVELNVNRKGRVLVVARDYGQVEEDYDKPLIGPAGILFDDVFSVSGLPRDHINITNVVPQTRPPYDDFRRHNPRDVELGRIALDRLVKRLKPSLIIAMGNEASYHFVEGWPTGGRGIFGAKGIEDRRGYFWETKYGWVLTLLHPAGAARKIVPGYELLRRDFVRMRQWLRGKLPRQEFPEVRVLKHALDVDMLSRSSALAFDIETHWNNVFCCGFTGDDLQPYVAKYGQGFKLMEQLLEGQRGQEGVAHNGPYDIDLLDRDGYSSALYTDDTQAAWGNGLEPELAFRDEGPGGGRLTRKGLASLATLCPKMNLPWWKTEYARYEHPDWVSGYPNFDVEEPADLSKLYTMGGRDAYVTRRLWTWLKPAMKKRKVEKQYRLALETNVRCITMTRRGWLVDEELRKKRMEVLEKRAEEAKQVSRAAALAYIEKHQIEAFRWTKQCWCCSGVGVRCWRCAGLPAMPKKKADWNALLTLEGGNGEEALKKYTVAQLKDMLPGCSTCNGIGSRTGYSFNPYSPQQLMKLLYDYVGAPKWVFKGKTHMDEMATLRLILWSEGRK